MVEEAQETKVPIQEFADKVTSIFVQTVLGIAALTFVLWLVFPDSLRQVTIWASAYLPWVNPNLGLITRTIFSTIAVLVIACPCALGSATPTALMVGTGMGSENGVLIRKGEAGSEHPLGEAIVRKTKDKEIEIKEISDFESITGKGVQAKLDEKKVVVGSRRLMEEQGIDSSQVEEKMQGLEEEAKTAMLIGLDDQLVGIIAVADPLKEDSKQAIADEVGIAIGTGTDIVLNLLMLH